MFWRPNTESAKASNLSFSLLYRRDFGPSLSRYSLPPECANHGDDWSRLDLLIMTFLALLHFTLPSSSRRSLKVRILLITYRRVKMSSLGLFAHNRDMHFSRSKTMQRTGGTSELWTPSARRPNSCDSRGQIVAVRCASASGVNINEHCRLLKF